MDSVLTDPFLLKKKKRSSIPRIRRVQRNNSNTDDDDDSGTDNNSTTRFVPLETRMECFGSNRVVTSKYTKWNFAPKFLRETFSTSTNVYFLIICILQLIPGITNTNGVPTQLFPLSIVIIVDAIFQIVEDKKRHLADRVANNQSVLCLNRTTDTFDEIRASDVHVGDILCIPNGEVAVADMVLLGIDSKDHHDLMSTCCYVDTSSLDGETNLKMREAISCTQSWILNPSDCSHLVGNVTCEKPNGDIHHFDGVLKFYCHGSAQEEPINISNVILRGVTVRNTTRIYGVVVNTGHETKVMQAASPCPSKKSGIESQVNNEFVIIVGFLLVFCASAATVAVLFNGIVLKNAWYVPLDGVNPLAVWFTTFLRFFLILSNMIPISLYVTLDIVKSLQSYFMSNDLEMYYDESDSPCVVRTMALNEDLGEISHIFTDKTGTLTCNVMDFKRCSINGVSYNGTATKESAGDSVMFVNFNDKNFDRDLKEEVDEKNKLHEFLEHLSLCHSIITEEVAEGTRLSASSPDEQALVAFAKKYGYEFKKRSPGKAFVKCDNDLIEFEVLNVLEFTSDRKRMSVVIKHLDSGVIELLVKGADNVIFPRIKTSDKMSRLESSTLSHLQQYAMEGLRTLVIAKRCISSAEYDDWSREYNAASNDLKEIQKKSAGRPNKIDKLASALESELTLLGATAIEDRLQDGAAKTIAAFRAAYVSIWMLTGDHPDTAANVARASSLIDDKMKVFKLTSKSSGGPCTDVIDFKSTLARRVEQFTVFQEAKQFVNNSGSSNAVIIDGDMLAHAFTDDCIEDFLTLVENTDVVIACRVSPGQKADIVSLIRDYYKKETVSNVRTLAIGDGANDVPMIQAAHVGIGISGHEGLQAANSSDYSIAQFRFLKRLLLAHGRFNYQRVSLVVSFIFYKNILLVMAQFWYSMVNGMSGQKFYNEWAVDLYNTIYTAGPIVCVGCLDADVPAWISERIPVLYRAENSIRFNRVMFWKWISSAFFESLVICMAAVLALGKETKTGHSFGMYEDGTVVFTLVILVVNCKLAIYQRKWSVIESTLWIMSIVLWVTSGFMLSVSPSFDWYNMFPNLLSTSIFWLVIIIAPIIALGKDVIYISWQRLFYPSVANVIQEYVVTSKEGDLNDLVDDVMYFSQRPSCSTGDGANVVVAPSTYGSPKKSQGTGYAVAFDEYTAHAESELCHHPSQL